jgi:hypothetical protein
MPYELVREGIETSLKEKWDQLREQVSQLEKLRDASDCPVGVKPETSSTVSHKSATTSSSVAAMTNTAECPVGKPVVDCVGENR